MQTRITIPRPDAEEYDPAAAHYIARVDAVNDASSEFEAQRDRMVDRLSRIGGDKATFRYAPGKWSVTEVIGHLADTERILAYRLLRIARGDETPLPGFDENTYVPTAAFDRRSLPDVLDEWVAVRNATLALVRGMPSEGWSRRGRANDRLVTTRALVYIVLGHVEHHLTIFAERYGV